MEETKKSVNSVTAGTIGVVAGAALGAAAATILSSKKNRKRVIDKLEELKTQATEKAKKIGSDVMDKLSTEKESTHKK
ncbi:MAG: hypothetical protein HYT83_04140 [Candidatus Levybacteria bacterium]|nr:hypothetical protein [Candidatus Levybacteria bacterium]